MTGVPGGMTLSRRSALTCRRMQPWEILAPAVPISRSPPSGPWMPRTASPEPSQSLIVLEWAEVTMMKGPYPSLGTGGGSMNATKKWPSGVGSSGAPTPAGAEKTSRPRSYSSRRVLFRSMTMP